MGYCCLYVLLITSYIWVVSFHYAVPEMFFLIIKSHPTAQCVGHMSLPLKAANAPMFQLQQIKMLKWKWNASFLWTENTGSVPGAPELTAGTVLNSIISARLSKTSAVWSKKAEVGVVIHVWVFFRNLPFIHVHPVDSLLGKLYLFVKTNSPTSTHFIIRSRLNTRTHFGFGHLELLPNL